MAKRLIQTLTSADKTTQSRIYRDGVYSEYIVQFYALGANGGYIENTEARYYTEDREDAHGTAELHVPGYEY